MNAVGQPISRIDGPLKVTGGARYTADIPVEAIVHGAIVYSTIANGRTVSIDTAAAENAPGVLAVLTHKNMPRMNQQSWSHLRPQGQTYLPLQDERIHYAGQPVALVIAATLDQANYAGTLIKVAYEARPPVVFDLRTAKEDAVEPPQRMWPLSSSVGDADKAIAGAAVKIQQTYTMSDRHHNPMEHATLAVWDGTGSLTLYNSTQMVVGTRKLVSLVLGIPEEKINVVCEFLGGEFGGKSWSWPHTLLAALAAKVVNRPVRLSLAAHRCTRWWVIRREPFRQLLSARTVTARCPASATTASTRHRCSTTTSSMPLWQAAICGVPAAGSPRATRSFT